VPLAHLLPLAELPLGHGEEESIETARSRGIWVQFDALFESRNCFLPLARAVVSHAESVPRIPRRQLDGLLGQFDGSDGVPQSKAGASGQKPRSVVQRYRIVRP